MRKNKKGFTLIELLAVLVVLAILALISVPIVLNIIEQSRTKARERSMEGFAKAVESAVYIYQMDHPTVSDPILVHLSATSKEAYIVSSADFSAASNQISSSDLNGKKQKVEYSGSAVVCGTSANNYSDGMSLVDSNNASKVILSNCTVDGHGTYSYSDGQGSKNQD